MRCLIAAWIILVSLAARSAADEPSAPPDTTAYRLPAVSVEGPRIPLAEIVRSARARERERAEGTPGVSFSRFRKMILSYGGEPARRFDVTEQVQRVSVTAPEKVEVVTLRQREYRSRPDTARVEKEKIDTGVGLEEFTTNILGVTLSLDNVDLFDYTLLDRHLFGEYLVYHIGFKPKSSFEPLPSGEVWIETGDLVVLHENAWFRDVVPLPAVIRSIDLVSRERERIEGRWVWTRQLVRVTTRLGAIGGPSRFELCDTHSDYVFPAAEASGAWLLGGRPGAAELDRFRRSIADSSAAVFTASLQQADEALADSLGRELQRAGFEKLREERGAPRARSGLVPMTGASGMNRVDGARPGLGLLALRGSWGVGLSGAYGTASKRGQGEAFLERSTAALSGEGLSLRLSFSDRTRTMLTNDFPGAGFVTLFGFDDPSDYFRRREVALTVSAPLARSLDAEARYAAGQDLALSRRMDRHPFREHDYRPNPRASAGHRTALGASLTNDVASDFARAVRFRVDGEWANPAIGPSNFRYGRFEGAIEWKPSPVGPAAARFFVRSGIASRRTPLQRRFSLGGASTLHAMRPNERTGEALVAGRVEFAAARRLLPDIPLAGRLQPAFFGEWGALRDDGRARKGAADAGVALDRYVGFFALESLRLTAAWRVPGGAPRVGLEFRGAGIW